MKSRNWEGQNDMSIRSGNWKWGSASSVRRFALVWWEGSFWHDRKLWGFTRRYKSVSWNYSRWR